MPVEKRNEDLSSFSTTFVYSSEVIGQVLYSLKSKDFVFIARFRPSLQSHPTGLRSVADYSLLCHPAVRRPEDLPPRFLNALMSWHIGVLYMSLPWYSYTFETGSYLGKTWLRALEQEAAYDSESILPRVGLTRTDALTLPPWAACTNCNWHKWMLLATKPANSLHAIRSILFVLISFILSSIGLGSYCCILFNVNP